MREIDSDTGSSLAIPDVDLGAFVLAAAARHNDGLAFIDGQSGRTLTYEWLTTAIRGFAAELAARGFTRGDVVALFIPNMPEYAIFFHGVALAGGVCTTANPLYTARELEHQLADSRARLLITTSALVDVARQAAKGAGVPEVLTLDADEPANSLRALLADPSAAPAVGIATTTDLAALPYSSGTTGLPKGVMLTHRNLVANLIQARAAVDVGPDDVVIAVLPFFHIYGLTTIMNLSLICGATLVTTPRFVLARFLELVERHRVTLIYAVPPIVSALAKDPSVAEYDLSSVRTIMSGAAPLGSELAEEAAARVGCEVKQGYGLTETSPVTHVVPPGETAPGSIGPPVASTECRLVDPATGQDAPPTEPGELWIRGPQVMQGYLNNPGATKATLVPDGWLRTGDIAVSDARGYFTIVGRLKELIKYKGYQVAPAELEALLMTHPQVGDAAVVGIPDEDAGEIPKAFVVPADADADVDGEELIAWVRDRVSPQKRIREIELIEAIPRSPSGKILRRQLVDTGQPMV